MEFETLMFIFGGASGAKGHVLRKRRKGISLVQVLIIIQYEVLS